MARNTFRQGNSNIWQGIQMARNQYVQHILLNISNISSVSEGLVQLTTGVNSPPGQLAAWSSHRDYLCLWHSLKSLLEAGTTGTLAALFQYFRQEWMTDERLPLWNVHNVNIRTNNHLEGWHNRLNRKAGKGHNGLYELLQLLIAEQGVMDTLIQQVLSGNATVVDKTGKQGLCSKATTVCTIYG
ncbi:hypothetical protein T09_8898 [Trichinella sp. T9]|nr:hypothetical protein T09_8898 [Trichinella sp. T9]